MRVHVHVFSIHGIRFVYCLVLQVRNDFFGHTHATRLRAYVRTYTGPSQPMYVCVYLHGVRCSCALLMYPSLSSLV